MAIKIITEHLSNMKKLLLIIAIVASIISCNGQQNSGFFGSYQGDVITKPDIWLQSATSITTNSAVIGGRIERGDGNLPIIRNGVCWNTTGVMDVLGADYYNMPVCHIKTGITCYFSMNVPFFLPNTKYYIQAYAENAYGINFSTQGWFTTLSAVTIPSVSTNTITNIASTTATGGGEVLNQGSSSVTARGICWSTSYNPTISQPLTPTSTGGRTSNSTGIGTFTSSIINAAGNTTYYVRAYATNSSGTAYGINQSFTTSGVLPTVSTNNIINITISAATSGGNVTNQGTSAVTERGVCYSTSLNPTTSQPTTTTATGGKILNGSGLGLFVCELSGLNTNTIYYTRAYAINSSGTSYGVNQSFTTTQQTMATLSSSLSSESQDIVVVNWRITLSQASTSAVIIPATITGNNGIGTSTFNFFIGEGVITAVEGIAYSKLSSSYTAYCSFGTMPSGFTGTNTASYVIPALGVTCTLPTFISAAYGNATTNSIEVNANINSDGGCPVTNRGFQYGTDNTFATVIGSVTVGSGIGQYGTTVTGLTCGTHYYFRPWVINSVGTYYANELIGSGAFTSNCPISCPAVGDSYGGGIVVYLFQSGDQGYVAGQCHGIIATSLDLSTGIQWYNGLYTSVGGTTTSIGSSVANTNSIVTALGPGSYAAKLCYDYTGGGFNDWVLPTSTEVVKLGYAGAPTEDYWSSLEIDSNRAGTVQPGFLPMTYADKALLKRVRAIRYF